MLILFALWSSRLETLWERCKAIGIGFMVRAFLGKAVLGAAPPGPVQHRGAVVSLPQVEGARSWVPKLLQKTGPEVSGGRTA